MTVPEQAVEAARVAICRTPDVGAVCDKERAAHCLCTAYARAALEAALPLMGVERPALQPLRVGREDALATVCAKLRAALDGLRPFPLDVEPVAAALIKEADEALALPAVQERRVPEGENDMQDEGTHVTIGLGLCDIGPIMSEGRTGVLVRPRPERIPFGEPGELQNTEYWPRKGDVVIWVEGDGPGILIKELAALSSPPAPASEGGWREIGRAPNDSDFRWYGLHVKHTKGHEWFEAHYVAHDDDGQMILPSGDNFDDWAFSDFEVWCDAPPLPAPPVAEPLLADKSEVKS